MDYFPPKLPSAIGEGQLLMAEQKYLHVMSVATRTYNFFAEERKLPPKVFDVTVTVMRVLHVAPRAFFKEIRLSRSWLVHVMQVEVNRSRQNLLTLISSPETNLMCV